MKTTPRLPDFLIIGAGKSGTTSLDFYLKQHPELFLPEHKEPNFFAYESFSESDFEEASTKNHFRLSISQLSTYQSLFENAKAHQKIGEVSNTYLYYQAALQSIKNHVPQTKLIAILRQPAERLFSRYQHLLRINQIPGRFPEDLEDENSIWWTRPDLVQEGFYFKHLKKFYSQFPSNQIKVFLFDDLKSKPSLLMKELCEFLEIDASFNFQLEYQLNQSGKVKNQGVNRWLGHNGKMANWIKKNNPGLHRKFRNSALVYGTLEKIRSKNLERLSMDPKWGQDITHKIYLQDIHRLEDLIGRDLSTWKKEN